MMKARSAAAQKRLDALPKIPVAFDDGNVVDVIVCWTHEQVAAYLKSWPSGQVSFSKLTEPGYKGPGTAQERAWLRERALELAGKAPKLSERFESMRAFARAVQSIKGQARRT